MRFDKDNGYENPNYEAELAIKKESSELIAVIDKNLKYASDDLSEYYIIKERFEAFEPKERIEDKLSPEERRMLESKFDRLYELAKSLK